MPKTALIYKHIGETPLEALERFRREQVALASHAPSGEDKSDQKLVTLWESVPMTYAGRLDPMAEGLLLILIGDECKHKEKYLGLDKEYEVEVLFGITSDTYDTLGIATVTSDEQLNLSKLDMKKYVGTCTQPYPAYSSKTVNGKQLHELARADDLPDDMPTKEVQIHSIEVLGTSTIEAADLKAQVLANVTKVTGDFRQAEIKEAWSLIQGTFPVTLIRVNCSSGTYMRSLAYRMGKDAGCKAIALSIKRTKIVM